VCHPPNLTYNLNYTITSEDKWFLVRQVFEALSSLVKVQSWFTVKLDDVL